MITIKVKVTATQKSETVDIQDTDGHAEFLDFGDTKRIVYQEGCGGINTLDIGEDYILMNRVHEWLTQIHFSQDENASARMVTEEGEIRFDIHVLELNIEEDQLYVQYELRDGDALIDVHTFKLVWSKEEEAWLEIH